MNQDNGKNFDIFKHQENLNQQTLQSISYHCKILKQLIENQKPIITSNLSQILFFFSNPIIFLQKELFQKNEFQQFLNRLLEELINLELPLSPKLVILRKIKILQFNFLDYSNLKIDEEKLLGIYSNEMSYNYDFMNLSLFEQFKLLLAHFIGQLKFYFKNQNPIVVFWNSQENLKQKLIYVRKFCQIEKLNKEKFEYLMDLVNKRKWTDFLEDKFFLGKLVQNNNFKFTEDFLNFFDLSFQNTLFHPQNEIKHNFQQKPKKKPKYEDKWIYQVIIKLLQTEEQKEKAFAYLNQIKFQLKTSLKNKQQSEFYYDYMSEVQMLFLKAIIFNRNQFYTKNLIILDDFVFQYYTYLILSNKFRGQFNKINLAMSQLYKQKFGDFLEEKLNYMLKNQKLSPQMILQFSKTVVRFLNQYNKFDLLEKLKKEFLLKLAQKNESQLQLILSSFFYQNFREKIYLTQNKKKDFLEFIQLMIENGWIFYSNFSLSNIQLEEIQLEESEIEQILIQIRTFLQNQPNLYEIENPKFYQKQKTLKHLLKILFAQNQKLIIPLFTKVFEFQELSFSDNKISSDQKILIKILCQITFNENDSIIYQNQMLKVLELFANLRDYNKMLLAEHIASQILKNSKNNNFQQIMNFMQQKLVQFKKELNEQNNKLNLGQFNFMILNLLIFTPQFFQIDNNEKQNLLTEFINIHEQITENLSHDHLLDTFECRVMNQKMFFLSIAENYSQQIIQSKGLVKFLNSIKPIQEEYFSKPVLLDQDCQTLLDILKKEKKFQTQNLSQYFQNPKIYSKWLAYSMVQLKAAQDQFLKRFLETCQNGLIEFNKIPLFYEKSCEELEVQVAVKDDHQIEEFINLILQFIGNEFLLFINKENSTFIAHFKICEELIKKNINILDKSNLVLKTIKILFNSDNLQNINLDFLTKENGENNFLIMLKQLFELFKFRKQPEIIKNNLTLLLSKNGSQNLTNFYTRLIIMFQISFLNVESQRFIIDKSINKEKANNWKELIENSQDEFCIVNQCEGSFIRKYDQRAEQLKLDIPIQLFQFLLEFINQQLNQIQTNTEEMMLQNIEKFLKESFQIEISLSLFNLFNNLIKISSNKTQKEMNQYFLNILKSEEKWNKTKHFLFHQIYFNRSICRCSQILDEYLFEYFKFLNDGFQIKNFQSLFEFQLVQALNLYVNPILIQKIFKFFQENSSSNKMKILLLYFAEFLDSFWIENPIELNSLKKMVLERKFSTPHSLTFYSLKTISFINSCLFSKPPLAYYYINGSTRKLQYQNNVLFQLFDSIEISLINLDYFIKSLMMIKQKPVEDNLIPFIQSLIRKLFQLFNTQNNQKEKEQLLNTLSQIILKLTKNQQKIIREEILQLSQQTNFLIAKQFLIKIIEMEEELNISDLEFLPFCRLVLKNLSNQNEFQINQYFGLSLKKMLNNKPEFLYEDYLIKFNEDFERNSKNSLEYNIFLNFFSSLQQKNLNILYKYFQTIKIFINQINSQDKILLSELSKYTHLIPNEELSRIEGYQGDYELFKELLEQTKNLFDYFN